MAHRPTDQERWARARRRQRAVHDGRSLIARADSDTALVLPTTGAGFAFSPDSPHLYIPGDIDIRALIQPDDWTPSAQNTIVAQYETTGNQRAWQFVIDTTGVLQVNTTDTGIGQVAGQSTIAPPGAVDRQALWVRVTEDVSNGANREARFYTSSDGISWSIFGDPVLHAAAMAGNMFDSNGAWTVGRLSGGQNQFRGKIHYVEVRSGIDGPIIANPDFRSIPVGQRSFRDTSSVRNLWNVVPPAVIGLAA